jgi:ribosomal protein L11 methyltransferase
MKQLIEIRLRFPASEIEAAEFAYASAGQAFAVLDEPELGLSPDLPPGTVELAFWPQEDSEEEAILELEERLPRRALSMVRARAGKVDWVERWKKYFHWEKVTPSLAVGPPWEPAPQDVTWRVMISPGEAFGTGNHATTRLCMGMAQEALAAFAAKGEPAPSVLDVGCGSGVVGIACRLIGAGRVLGTDIDELVLDECARNCLLNDAPMEVVTDPLDQVPGRFQLVLANILPNTLKTLASELDRHTAPGGVLVLSGVPENAAASFLPSFLAMLSRPATVTQRVLDTWWAATLTFDR